MKINAQTKRNEIRKRYGNARKAALKSMVVRGLRATGVNDHNDASLKSHNTIAIDKTLQDKFY